MGANFKSWVEGFEKLPVTPTGKLLLVPKAVVRQHLAYTVDDYYGNYLLTHLKQIELDAGSSLVYIVKKTKSPNVTKKDLRKKFGSKKETSFGRRLSIPTYSGPTKKPKI